MRPLLLFVCTILALATSAYAASGAVNVTLLNETFDQLRTCSAVCQQACQLVLSSTGQASRWTNPADDDTDWTVQVSTPTPLTGPDFDHTSGLGNFIYVEATNLGSRLCTPGKRANLLSPSFTVPARAELLVLTYWASLYGADMGSLSIDILRVETSTWTLGMNVLSGDKGDFWLQQIVDLTSFVGSTLQIRFRATTGSGTYSDLAIDDVSVVAQMPTPTPSLTPTRTNTGTATTSPTSTPIPTVTPTGTSTSTHSRSITLTASSTLTRPRTTSVTLTPSSTTTKSPSETTTPSGATPTVTPTPLRSATPSLTGTPTRTPSRSVPPLPTKSRTPSLTPTETLSRSRSPTVTFSQSRSRTPTSSKSPSLTTTTSLTPTHVVLTVSRTSTSTRSHTPSSTLPPTGTRSPTLPPTGTPTLTGIDVCSREWPKWATPMLCVGIVCSLALEILKYASNTCPWRRHKAFDFAQTRRSTVFHDLWHNAGTRASRSASVPTIAPVPLELPHEGQPSASQPECGNENSSEQEAQDTRAVRFAAATLLQVLHCALTFLTTALLVQFMVRLREQLQDGATQRRSAAWQSLWWAGVTTLLDIDLPWQVSSWRLLIVGSFLRMIFIVLLVATVAVPLARFAEWGAGRCVYLDSEDAVPWLRLWAAALLLGNVFVAFGSLLVGYYCKIVEPVVEDEPLDRPRSMRERLPSLWPAPVLPNQVSLDDAASTSSRRQSATSLSYNRQASVEQAATPTNLMAHRTDWPSSANASELDIQAAAMRAEAMALHGAGCPATPVDQAVSPSTSHRSSATTDQHLSPPRPEPPAFAVGDIETFLARASIGNLPRPAEQFVTATPDEKKTRRFCAPRELAAILKKRAPAVLNRAPLLFATTGCAIGLALSALRFPFILDGEQQKRPVPLWMWAITPLAELWISGAGVGFLMFIPRFYVSTKNTLASPLLFLVSNMSPYLLILQLARRADAPKNKTSITSLVSPEWVVVTVVPVVIISGLWGVRCLWLAVRLWRHRH